VCVKFCKSDHDRLARSTFDLFAIVKRIVDAGALPLTGRAMG
jgi:hypothetical protein